MSTARPLRCLAIVNRGEAAMRCVRAVKTLRQVEGGGLSALALYTEVDREAPFVRHADAAVALHTRGGAAGAYLDHERLLDAIRRGGADAVWPGWGFVAEDAQFVDRVEALGLCFLGPSATSMRRLGDKIAAKRLAESLGIAVTPWSGGAVADLEAARRHARALGYPIAIKAAAGGGGRGIRMVDSGGDLVDALRAAGSEAAAAFGDGRLFMERRIDGGRHIEVQIAGDIYGRVVALGCRDCSVQRRHQKIIEETPPPGIPGEVLMALEDAAVTLAGAVGYRGVGTVEFLVTPAAFYFLEVNPRLQVEHGITEAVTGIDLVHLQIRIARGEPVPAAPPRCHGVAIEARICAEDPDAGFLPAPGRVVRFDAPGGHGVRVDTGVVAGSPVPPDFDSLLAKIIAQGDTREEARARLAAALSDCELVIAGGATNKGYLVDIIEAPDYREARLDTTWLDRWSARRGAGRFALESLVAAAVLAYQHARQVAAVNFFADPGGVALNRVAPSVGERIDLSYRGHPYRLQVHALGSRSYRVHLDGRALAVALREDGPHAARLLIDARSLRVLHDLTEAHVRIEIEGHAHRFSRQEAGQVCASAPAIVVALHVRCGERVGAGQVIGLLEAMKMEIAVRAPVSGVVRELRARKSQQVAAGDVLLVIDPAPDGVTPTAGARLELPAQADPLELFVAEGGGQGERGAPVVDLTAVDRATAEVRHAGLAAAREEIRRVLLGYDTDDRRTDLLVAVLEAALPERLSAEFRREWADVRHELAVFADVEQLFARTPRLGPSGALRPSNEARLRTYIRRMRAGGAGMAEGFLAMLSKALGHYGLPDLTPSDALERAVMRLLASQRAPERRYRLVIAVLRRLAALSRSGVDLTKEAGLAKALARIARLRGLVTDAVADAAIETRQVVFEPRQAASTENSPKDASADEARGAGGTIGVDPEAAARIDLARLAGFEIEALDGPPDIYAFYGRSREVPDDERVFIMADVRGPAANRTTDMRAHIEAFERAFEAATRSLRSILNLRDPRRRLHWNRIALFVAPEVSLDASAAERVARRLAPGTRHLGLDKVVVRLHLVERGAPRLVRPVEIVIADPTGNRMEITWREPHRAPLRAANAYERKVADARRRGLVYPYEIIRMLTGGSAGEGEPVGPTAGSSSGATAHLAAGTFEEFDLAAGGGPPVAASVAGRAYGLNTGSIVFGIISTPAEKVPEGLRRVLILSDPTVGMGSLAAPECDRIVAAIDLAERLSLPVEWLPVSSGARIAMDSGTENLDATARVVRRIVTFTDAGGVIHVIVHGVNVGAQSYFNALATMLMHTRGALIMTPEASMVLTGRAALEASGSVAAEDEIAIGGFERIMGPNGEAQYYAHNLADAYRLLYEHYLYTYVAPGERGPRRRVTADPPDRAVTEAPYDEDGTGGLTASAPEEDAGGKTAGTEASATGAGGAHPEFRTVGDVFDDGLNPGRKRPFAMRALMRAVIDQDGGHLERWRALAGGETAIVWDAHLGGQPVCLIGIESQPIPREGYRPLDGPSSWTGGTLFPLSSKKVARALYAASGNRPAVVLANLSGFDGSPESMRQLQLEYGAEIARAVVRFEGPLLFAVVSRYHGGAYVVFSRALNDTLRAAAIEGAFASVIGGSAAASVVFAREVRARAAADPLVRAGREQARGQLSAELEELLAQVSLEKQAEVAAEFDAIHTVERARAVGSLDEIIPARELRPYLIRGLGVGG